METSNINLKLVVFAQNERVRVINIEDYEGLDTEISAFGFTEKGEPVTNPQQPVKYRVTGQSHGGVNLNNVYSRGLYMDHVERKPTGRYDDHGRPITEFVKPKRLFGWESVSMQLSRNGCHADPKTIQEATENLIRSGLSRVHYYRLCNVNGMAQSYGMFEDKWVVGDVPEVNYDVFNRLLKKIGSQWRIQTPNTMKLLRKLELQKLTQETENL